jgi:hypothetical protein
VYSLTEFVVEAPSLSKQVEDIILAFPGANRGKVCCVMYSMNGAQLPSEFEDVVSVGEVYGIDSVYFVVCARAQSACVGSPCRSRRTVSLCALCVTRSYQSYRCQGYGVTCGCVVLRCMQLTDKCILCVIVVC